MALAKFALLSLDGCFIRKYVPELKDFPKKHIYEPTKAPIAEQKKAGVLVKGDGTENEIDGYKVYPKPMFDFGERREICIQGMKNAYHVGMYGTHEAVLDGSWKKAFDDAAEGPTTGDQGGPGGLDTYSDADGAEEASPDEPGRLKLKKQGSKGAASSSNASPTSSTRTGHKREHSQSTLDGAFEKKRTKG